MTFPKLFAMLTIAGVCGFAASVASAATVEVTFDTPNIFNGSGYDNVLISYPGTVNQGVSAGRFQGTGSNVVGVPESIFVDGLNDLYMYCYDVYQHISAGQNLVYDIKLGGEMARTLDFLGAVNSVMNQGKTNDPFAWLHPLSGYQGAAIQLGIWESKYETNTESGWDLTSGTFTASDLDDETQNWWNQFKNAIGAPSLDGKYVMTLENGTYQDMITGDPSPSEVPEPGSLALLGVALAGLAATRRKKAIAE